MGSLFIFVGGAALGMAAVWLAVLFIALLFFGSDDAVFVAVSVALSVLAAVGGGCLALMLA